MNKLGAKRILYTQLKEQFEKQLRVCANRGKGCKSPYFISSDKREKYCSEDCTQAAQRRVKLEWWNKNRRNK